MSNSNHCGVPAALPPFSNWAPWRHDMENFLAELRGQQVLYLPNPGNGGDSLIATATYQAFDRAGIEIELAHLDTPVEGRTVILAGGGNLVPISEDVQQALERFAPRASRLILLPHTIRGHDGLLAQLDARCTLFVRDQSSLDHVRQANPSLDVRLAHDMAFHLDVRKLLADPALRCLGPAIVSAGLEAAGLSEEMLKSWPSVEYLRTDAESTARFPMTDLDISVLCMMGVNPDEAPLAAWCFLHLIALAAHVHTDRLHVGIGAALMGVPCTLRDNDYGKNSSVFAQSLHGVRGMRMIQRPIGDKKCKSEPACVQINAPVGANDTSYSLSRREDLWQAEIRALQEANAELQAHVEDAELALAQTIARWRTEIEALTMTAPGARRIPLLQRLGPIFRAWMPSRKGCTD